jgi:hypothetical protein
MLLVEQGEPGEFEEELFRAGAFEGDGGFQVRLGAFDGQHGAAAEPFMGDRAAGG